MWRDQLLAQASFYWDVHLRPRLADLTDDEYFWEPAPGSWSIRPSVDGKWQIDWAWPTPTPPPVTTIAWRLAHIGIQMYGIRWSAHFSDGSIRLETIRWPSSAAQAVGYLDEYYERWMTSVGALSEEDLAKPAGPAEGQWANEPFAGLVFHLNRELMHHGGEICLLRDLYRATRT